MDTLVPLVVHNLSSEREITIGWNNHFVTIPPGESRTATWDAVINFFGDPRAVDDMFSAKDDAGVVSWVPDRATEVRRLRSKWGNSFAVEEGKIIGPPVEITNLQGERIWTVYEDPQGEHVNPRLIAVENQQNLDTQIRQLQKQVETLQRMQMTGDLPVDTSEAPPVDDSASPKRGGRVMGKAAVEDG
jgi:hypothetical protein